MIHWRMPCANTALFSWTYCLLAWPGWTSQARVRNNGLPWHLALRSAVPKTECSTKVYHVLETTGIH
jgi:hypothetical protein